jgi:hypothetical protein
MVFDHAALFWACAWAFDVHEDPIVGIEGVLAG